MDNKEIIALEKEIKPVVSQASKLVIKSAEDMKEATKTLSVLNKYSDQVVAKREAITKPMNEALKNARALFKPLETALDENIERIRSAMSTYQTEEIKRQRIEEAKIVSRIGDGKGKIKLETAVAKIEGMNTVEEKVTTEEGVVKFREDKVLKVTDPSLIPDKYFTLNESLVLSDLKKGVDVPGATLDIKLVPLNFR